MSRWPTEPSVWPAVFSCPSYAGLARHLIVSKLSLSGLVQQSLDRRFRRVNAMRNADAVVCVSR